MASIQMYSLSLGLSAVQLHDVGVMHDVKELFTRYTPTSLQLHGAREGLGVVSFRFSFCFLFLCFLNYYSTPVQSLGELPTTDKYNFSL